MITLAVIDLTWWDLALAAALILINAGASLALRLGLEKRLLVASLRTLVQLSLLGLVLQWVFRQPGPWAVVGMMLVMVLLAGWEAVRRTTYRVRGGYLVSMSVMFIASMTVTLYGVVVILGVRPWYTPHFVIPILGMLLGNTLNGISLGLETEDHRQQGIEAEYLGRHAARIDFLSLAMRGARGPDLRVPILGQTFDPLHLPGLRALEARGAVHDHQGRFEVGGEDGSVLRLPVAARAHREYG